MGRISYSLQPIVTLHLSTGVQISYNEITSLCSYRSTSTIDSWPGPIHEEHNNLTKIYVLSDVHIMGPVKSARIDKLRREWQMEQAYRISNKIYNPDMVIFLGDIIDEGSFSSNDAFNIACQDFLRIFPPDESQVRVVIAGNHDVGFHDRMLHFPFLMHRFYEKFNATPNLDLIKFNGLNLIASNSMSFYNDTCPFCSYSIARTNELSNRLDNESNTSPNDYASPILLIHIPLYRPYDTSCEFPNVLRDRVKKKNIEGEEVLHELASQFILEKLKPRLILSGHTHMNCLTNHTMSNEQQKGKLFQELSISSFNHKYAEKEPGFLLLSANSTHLYTRHCGVVNEGIIVLIYVTVLLIICFRLAFSLKGASRLKINGKSNN